MIARPTLLRRLRPERSDRAQSVAASTRGVSHAFGTGAAAERSTLLPRSRAATDQQMSASCEPIQVRQRKSAEIKKERRSLWPAN